MRKEQWFILGIIFILLFVFNFNVNSNLESKVYHNTQINYSAINTNNLIIYSLGEITLLNSYILSKYLLIIFSSLGAGFILCGVIEYYYERKSNK